jgi:hypothetical protein
VKKCRLAETGAIRFTMNGYTVRAVTDVSRGSGWLKATLRLEGTSVPAQVSFSFAKPEVLQVLLSFNNGIPAEMREEFADQGEHAYGIWEMPFGGSIDDRGADHDFMGIRHQADVNYSSARAPFYATSKKYGVYVETAGKGKFAVAVGGKTSFFVFRYAIEVRRNLRPVVQGDSGSLQRVRGGDIRRRGTVTHGARLRGSKYR